MVDSSFKRFGPVEYHWVWWFAQIVVASTIYSLGVSQIITISTPYFEEGLLRMNTRNLRPCLNLSINSDPTTLIPGSNTIPFIARRCLQEDANKPLRQINKFGSYQF